MSNSALSPSVTVFLVCGLWLYPSSHVYACGQHVTTSMMMVVIVVTAAAASPARAGTTKDSRCITDNGLVADESSCRGFLICLQGKARPMRCSRDLLFNQQRLTCDFPGNVHCGKRPMHTGSSTCYSAMINVTVRVTNEIRAPQFEAKLTVKAQRQPLRYILLIAAGLDPRFRYETQYFDGYGDYVSSINGVSNDVTANLAVWQPFDKKGQVIPHNVDDYIPENDAEIVYRYMDALGSSH